MYDPSSKDKKQIWLQIAKFKPRTPLAGDIMLKLIFHMPRPKSHYRTGKYKHLLKTDAPFFHSSTPDLDNIVKLVADALNGVFYKDDSQIAQLKAEKIYCTPSEKPKTEIHIEQL